MSSLINVFDAVRSSGTGGWLVRTWHRHAPAFPVRRKLFGLSIYFDFRDHPAYILSPTRQMEKGDPIFDLLLSFHGMVWDVGSNVGMVSLRAAALGHPVVAFDISRKALDLLDRGAKENHLAINMVGRAFSVSSFSYHAPDSASTENHISDGKESANAQSITWSEAARMFGVPRFIKMDIEGHELEFLESQEFKRWVMENNIIWFLEIHDPGFREKFWKECPVRELDSQHFLFNHHLLEKTTG